VTWKRLERGERQNSCSNGGGKIATAEPGSGVRGWREKPWRRSCPVGRGENRVGGSGCGGVGVILNKVIPSEAFNDAKNAQ